MNKTILNKNEKIEDLCLDGLGIIQSTSLYRFTSDAVILANFVRAKPTDKLLDLGSGSGIISILVCYKNNLSNVVGVELQPELAEMATRSVELNNLTNKIKIINANMKNLASLNLPEFDVITCNPPYKKIGTSKFNENVSEKIARHEVEIVLKEICEVAYKNLKFGGKFYISFDAVRSAELIYELKLAKLEPKRLFYTQSSPSSEAKLIFVEAVKGGKEGVRVLPMLITNDKDGRYLETIKKIKLF